MATIPFSRSRVARNFKRLYQDDWKYHSNTDKHRAKERIKLARVRAEAEELGLEIRLEYDYDYTFENWYQERDDDAPEFTRAKRKAAAFKYWEEEANPIGAIVSKDKITYETIWGFFNQADFWNSGYEYQLLRQSIDDFYADKFR